MYFYSCIISFFNRSCILFIFATCLIGAFCLQKSNYSIRWGIALIRQSYWIAIFDAISELRLISFLNLNHWKYLRPNNLFSLWLVSSSIRYILYYIDMYFSFRQALAIYGLKITAVMSTIIKPPMRFRIKHVSIVLI